MPATGTKEYQSFATANDVQLRGAHSLRCAYFVSTPNNGDGLIVIVMRFYNGPSKNF